MKKILLFFGSVVLGLTLLVAPVTHTYGAEAITANTLSAQGVVVQERMVSVLGEYVKFLQMQLILKLKAKVALLEALRSK